MKTTQNESQSLHLDREQVLALVRAMIGDPGREDDHRSSAPGPWDSVIRVGLEELSFDTRAEPLRPFGSGDAHSRSSERARNESSTAESIVAFESIFRSHPEAFDMLGGRGGFGDEVALNPQPLPPRYAFLIAVARAVIRRAELLQEVAGAAAPDGSERGIISVGGYTKRFSDDWCGTPFLLRWPSPGPRPRWFSEQLDGVDLLVLATQFDRAAHEAFDRELRGHLKAAGARFADVGVSRLQKSLNGPAGRPPR